MIQQSSNGQVFKLRTKGADGQPLWAYRYRFEGRGSARAAGGRFRESRPRPKRRFGRCSIGSGRAGGRATTTLSDLVDEYLEMHQVAPVTIVPSCAGCWARPRPPLATNASRISPRRMSMRGGLPGSSIAMSDQHYGHLANDSRQHARLTPRCTRARADRGRCVDVDERASNLNAQASFQNSVASIPLPSGRARWTRTVDPFLTILVHATNGNRWQRFWLV